ncbi:MAG: pilus assembly protein [Chloroflexi bacterium]|nr:pilus assembly protein [Chloroflexota bacterium]
MKKRVARWSKENGQSLVELAISFTFLLMLLGGLVDLGRMFFAFITLQDATQEGVIYGSYNPADVQGIKDRIRSAATSPIDTSEIPESNIEVNYHTTICPGMGIEVQATYLFQFVMPLIPTVIGTEEVPLTAHVTDTILQSTTTPCP